ncbi:MAG: hypothetical protein ACYS18_07690 [Planctomycetota bacterium]|jgi:hypothetical protein
MGFLSKVFGYVPAEERKGIYLADRPCWEISGVKDFPAMLKALCDLVPAGSVLYLEGGDPPKKIRLFLEARTATKTYKVEMGTIWPRPKCFHMQMTTENIKGLAELAEKCASPEIAIHLHVYKVGKMLLQWYDAFFDPLLVSKEIPETLIREFCDKLGAKYKECTEP